MTGRASRWLGAVMATAALVTSPAVGPVYAAPVGVPAAGDPYLIVDCLLPGATQRLGRRMVIAGRRSLDRIPARDCEIRGGEYTTSDRSSWATSLSIWRPLADSGDARAQTFVADILAKGVVGAPDYPQAVSWYQKAAAQGYGPAMFTLGTLYENGQGVGRDRQTAVNWYRRAAGLSVAKFDNVSFGAAPDPALAQVQIQLTQARSETTQLREQIRQLQAAAAASSQAQAAREDAIRRDRDRITAESAAVARDRVAIEAATRAAAANSSTSTQAQAQIHSRLAEITLREQALSAQEQAIAARERDAAQKAAELQRLQTQLDSRRDALATQAVAATPALARTTPLAPSAPPQIVMLDPQLISTRGESMVVAAPDATSQVISGRVRTARAGLMSLTINGARAAPTAAGVFSAELPVGQSATPVQIVAVDAAGGRSELRFELRRGAVAPPPSTLQRAREIVSHANLGKFHALLIGNAHYQGGWSELKTPGRDIDDMGQVLHDQYGFEVEYVRDATRQAIGSALYNLRQKLTENDSVVIYYAGHGAFLPTPTGDRGFWIPTDGDRADPTNWIAADTIHEWVGMLAARKVLVISDSCFSGLLMRSGSAFVQAGQSEDAQLELLKNEAEGRSRTYLTSGRDAPVLDQGGTGGQHSIFAQALIDTLKANHDVTTGRALSARVEQTVLYLSRVATHDAASQQPDYQPMRTAGHVAGDFIFVPRQ